MVDKKLVVEMSDSGNGKFIPALKSLFANTIKPDLVFLKLSQIEYPRRNMDLPKDLLAYVAQNPRVKFLWSEKNPLADNENYEILDVSKCRVFPSTFIEGKIKCGRHEYLDMTMISVFYDAGINELRKEATRKAVSHWMEQYHLPDEILFVELGFNGIFTFSQDDFPKQVQYFRIEGDDSHKFLFQKEHLWNIAAKKARNDKLVFVDSDISPLKNVDWFKQLYDILDKCLFTQGFKTITYLDEKDSFEMKKKSYTSLILDQETVSSSAGVPGGVYCICKSTLRRMNFFNYLPFGGGDNLFWCEFVGMPHANCCIRIFKRNWVSSEMEQLAVESGKKILADVPVDVFHFYHGNMRGRSHTQRHFMALTQFPWMDSVISEDNVGLLCWLDTKHFFYGIMSQIGIVNDDKTIAAGLFGEHIDYLNFIQGIRKLQSKANLGLDRLQLVRSVCNLKQAYSK